MIEEMGVKFPKHLYAFKLGQRDKIENKDGWIELHQWAKRQLETIIDKGNLHQAWIDIQKIDELDNDSFGKYYGCGVKAVISSLKKLTPSLVDLDGVMVDFLAKHCEMQKNKAVHKQIKAIQKIAKDYHVDFTCPKGVRPTHEIKKLYQEVLKKYDMLPLLARDIWSYEWNSKAAKLISNYVNVIDVCNASEGGSKE